MKRPMLLLSISLIAGILCGYISNSYFYSLLVLCSIAFVMAVVYKRYPQLLLLIVGILLFFLIGAFEYLYINNRNIGRFEAFKDKEVLISGVVSSEANIKESRISYIVKISEIISEGTLYRVRGKILLSMPRNEELLIYDYGTKIRITGILCLPKGRRNPGGFDYQRYLTQQGVSSTVFALESNVLLEGRHSGNIMTKAGLFFRSRIVNVIARSLPEQQAGLLNGMLIGYREGLSREVQNTFSDSGLTHIMAVSGANVAFIVLPLILLFRRIGIKLEISNIIIIFLLVLFVYITGFSPSVVRAVIMAVAMLTAQIIRREPDVITSIAFSAIILLLYNPSCLFDIGFQLSFAATLSLVLFYKGIKARISFKHIPAFAADILAGTLAAQIGVLPILAYHFNKISVVSILSNLLVAPAIQLITILGLGMAALGQASIVLSRLIGYINCTLLSFILYVSKLSASIPYAVINTVTPSIFIVMLYYITVLSLLWKKSLARFKVNIRYYFAAIGFLTVISISVSFIPKGLEVVFIDVGQGDSAFIRTNSGKTILIDGGGSSAKSLAQTNVGESIIIPFLLDYGVMKLNLVVATHGHDDHIQGLKPVLKAFNVDNLILPAVTDKKEFSELISISEARGIKIVDCQKGDIVKVDKTTLLNILHPQRSSNISKSSLNNNSIVLKLSYKDVRMLFTGDIEEEAEDMLLHEEAEIEADILKVAHHGSETSSNIEFLRQVKPKVAVISVGKNNFGHPGAETIDRLLGVNAKLFRTDEDGAVIVTSNGKNFKIRKMVTVKQ